MGGQRVSTLVLAEGDIERQFDRQVRGGDWDDAADLAVNHRDRCTPEALATEQPVFQSVLDGSVAGSSGLKRGGDRVLGGFTGEAVEAAYARVDHGPVALEGCTQWCCGVVALPLDEDPSNLYAVSLCEVVIALVVTRYRHHSTGTVGSNHEIARVDWYLLSIQGIDCVAPEENAFLLLQHVDSLKLGHPQALVAQLAPVSLPLGVRAQHLAQWMLWGQGDEGHAEDGVRSRGESSNDRIGASHREIDVSTVGASNPIALHRLDVLWEGDVVNLVE